MISLKALFIVTTIVYVSIHNAQALRTAAFPIGMSKFIPNQTKFDQQKQLSCVCFQGVCSTEKRCQVLCRRLTT